MDDIKIESASDDKSVKIQLNSLEDIREENEFTPMTKNEVTPGTQKDSTGRSKNYSGFSKERLHS